MINQTGITVLHNSSWGTHNGTRHARPLDHKQPVEGLFREYQTTISSSYKWAPSFCIGNKHFERLCCTIKPADSGHRAFHRKTCTCSRRPTETSLSRKWSRPITISASVIKEENQDEVWTIQNRFWMQYIKPCVAEDPCFLLRSTDWYEAEIDSLM